MIFMMLPIGVKRDENPQKGHDGGAPIIPMIGKKIAYTTLVSTIVWLVLFGLTEIGVINYREIVSYK